MTKRLLNPSEVIAKALGGRAICRKCVAFERARLAGQASTATDHLRCDDIECGCRCQDAARTN